MTWVCKSERRGSSETKGTEQVGPGAGLWEEGPWNRVCTGKKGKGSPGSGGVSRGQEWGAQCGRRTLAHC